MVKSEQTRILTRLPALVDAVPLAVLTLAPLAYGSVDLLFIAIWCIALALAIILRPPRRVHPWAIIYPPMVVATATVVGVVVAQMLLPARDFGGDGGWRAAHDLLGSRQASWSATQSGPWLALGAPLLFALVFQWSFEWGWRRSNARRLMLLLVGSATAVAVTSIFLRVFLSGLNLGRSSPAYAHVLTGPFVNRNTAAAYWGSATLVAWLWMLRDFERSRALDPAFGGIYSFIASWKAVAVSAACLVCFTATVLTASRSVVMITAALLVFTLGMRRYQKGGTLTAVAVAGSLAFIAVAGFAELGGGLLAQRIYARGLDDPYRWEAYKSTVAMIKAHPWLGVGLGNFEAAFPAYRSAALGSFGIWEHAHSVPLEIAAELGLPAAAVVIAAWLAAGLRLLRGSLSRTGSGFYPLAGLSVGLLGTLHSAIDFSLLIPGYAVLFAGITGCGLAQSCRADEQRRSAPALDVDSEAKKGGVARPARALNVMVATPLGQGGRGGIDQIMDEIRREHARTMPRNLRLTFVTTRGKGHLAFSPLFLVAALARLALARAVRRVNVLHINLSSHGSNTRKMLLCRAARLLRVPYVVHLHGSRYRQFYSSLDARSIAATAAMFRSASRVIVLGNVWKRFLVDAGIVDGDRVLVLPNATRAPRRSRQPAAGSLLILFLGRVGERKGVPVLIRALEGMGRQEGWHAIIAGDGDVAATAIDLTAKRLADRVTLTGWVDRNEVERLLSQADILVLPSFDENLPMSVIEGMAHGLAVVATPVGAVAEIVADGRNGLLVPPGDADLLRDALLRLKDDAELRRRLGAAARAYHRDQLEIGSYARRLAAIWQDVVGRVEPVAAPRPSPISAETLRRHD